MILLGLILLLAGVGAATLAFMATSGQPGTIEVEALGFTRQVSALELVVLGAAATLLVCLGWAAVAASTRRRARLRREERDHERLAEVERAAESERAEFDRRLAEGGARDEDLNRREDELYAREQELARREAEWRDREGPSVADVVTGRAEGSVADGTAQWAAPPVDPDAPPLHRPERRYHA